MKAARVQSDTMASRATELPITIRESSIDKVTLM